MDLRSLTDDKLIASADLVVQKERAILTELLSYLHEVDRRKLFSAYGYKSLTEFAIVRWQYSKSQAYRRIAAMKLLRQVPSLEEKMNSGAITLCHINVAHSVIQAERRVDKPYSARQKAELIDKLSHTSIREAEKIAFTLVSEPAALAKDQIKTQRNNKIEIKFIADEEVQEKIEHLRGLLAHKNPHITLGELFNKLCDLGIKQWTPQTEVRKNTRSSIQSEQGLASNVPKKVATLKKLTHVKDLGKIEAANIANKTTKMIAAKPLSYAEIIRQVRKRADSKCENCGSTYALEREHRIPRAKGGTSELENMRLFCRSCNQRAAIEEFGAAKMEHYILRV